MLQRIMLSWVLILSFAFAVQANTADKQSFTIRRGVNLSHWLSQSERRGAERQAYIQKKDIDFLASLGYDHIRLPVDEEQLWDEAGKKEPEAFALLHQGIGWAQQAGLRIIVDLHILRSHYFNAKEKPLWTDPKAQETFLDLWRDLSAELEKYPVSLVAYELMNEAVADDHNDWNKLIARGIGVIREKESERKIVVGSNRWQKTETFDHLRVPKGDRNLILSFHFYTPMLVTHYRAPWASMGPYEGPVHYPGQLVTPEDVGKEKPEIQAVIQQYNGVSNQEVLEKKLAKPLRVAKELGLPLYCGEWGAGIRTPREIRLQWTQDVRENLEKHNIAWANWDYKGDFSIIQGEGQTDEELVQAFMGTSKER